MSNTLTSNPKTNQIHSKFGYTKYNGKFTGEGINRPHHHHPVGLRRSNLSPQAPAFSPIGYSYTTTNQQPQNNAPRNVMNPYTQTDQQFYSSSSAFLPPGLLSHNVPNPPTDQQIHPSSSSSAFLITPGLLPHNVNINTNNNSTSNNNTSILSLLYPYTPLQPVIPNNSHSLVLDNNVLSTRLAQCEYELNQMKELNIHNQNHNQNGYNQMQQLYHQYALNQQLFHVAQQVMFGFGSQPPTLNNSEPNAQSIINPLPESVDHLAQQSAQESATQTQQSASHNSTTTDENQAEEEQTEGDGSECDDNDDNDTDDSEESDKSDEPVEPSPEIIALTGDVQSKFDQLLHDHKQLQLQHELQLQSVSMKYDTLQSQYSEQLLKFQCQQSEKERIEGECAEQLKRIQQLKLLNQTHIVKIKSCEELISSLTSKVEEFDKNASQREILLSKLSKRIQVYEEAELKNTKKMEIESKSDQIVDHSQCEHTLSATVKHYENKMKQMEESHSKKTDKKVDTLNQLIKSLAEKSKSLESKLVEKSKLCESQSKELKFAQAESDKLRFELTAQQKKWTEHQSDDAFLKSCLNSLTSEELKQGKTVLNSFDVLRVSCPSMSKPDDLRLELINFLSARGFAFQYLLSMEEANQKTILQSESELKQYQEIMQQIIVSNVMKESASPSSGGSTEEVSLFAFTPMSERLRQLQNQNELLNTQIKSLQDRVSIQHKQRYQMIKDYATSVYKQLFRIFAIMVKFYMCSCRANNGSQTVQKLKQHVFKDIMEAKDGNLMYLCEPSANRDDAFNIAFIPTNNHLSLQIVANDNNNNNNADTCTDTGIKFARIEATNL